MPNGIPSLFAKYVIINEKEKILDGVSSALLIALVSSSIVTLIFFFSANKLASFFSMPDAERVLSCFAFSIIPLTVSFVISAYYRTVKDVKLKVIFQDIIPVFSRVVLLFILLLFFKANVFHVFYFSPKPLALMIC